MRLRTILPILGLLALAACGDDTANQTGSTNNAGSTTTAPATPNNSPNTTAPATPNTPAAPRP
jgi:hypothetical protein